MKKKLGNKSVYLVASASTIILLIFMFGCQGDAPSIPTTTAMPSSAITFLPTHTPIPPSSTPEPPIYFASGVPGEIKVTEQEIEIDFDLHVSGLQSGEYVIYAVNGTGLDSEIWIMSPDGGGKQRILTCKHCPMPLESVFNVSLSVGTPVLIASELFFDTTSWKRAGRFLSLIDEKSPRQITCKNLGTNEDCWGYRPYPASQWLVFNAGDMMLIRNFSGDWWTITGRVFQFNDWSLRSWSPDGHGVALVANPRACAQQPSLYYLDFENQSIQDWSALSCHFEQPDSSFVGWSPDGKQIAFVWGEQYLERLVVCPADALVTGDAESCSEVIGQGTLPVIMLNEYRIGEGGGNLVGWFQWLTDEQFLWVNPPQVYGDKFRLGVLDLKGRITTLYQYPYPDYWSMHNISLSRDRKRILYRLDYYDTLNIFDLSSGININLGVEDRSFGANWLYIP